MNRPTKDRIGAHIYNIEWKNNTWQVETRKFGECSFNTSIIRIYESMALSRIAEIFVHEVCHAIYDSLFRNDENINSESAADLCSYHMIDFWKDNPKAFDWWISLVKEQ